MKVFRGEINSSESSEEQRP